MSSFQAANQARVKLKMQLYLYSWYDSSSIVSSSDGYDVVINVSRIDDQIRKIIPQVVDGVAIRTEVDNKKG